MERLATARGDLRFARLERPWTFASPFAERAFAVMLVSGERGVDPAEQWDLALQLVHAGCRYAVCAGPECSSWEDAIDMVGVIDAVDGRAAADVVTTWHEDEPIDDVAAFFAQHACTQRNGLATGVVLVLGGAPELAATVRAAVVAAFAGKA